MRHRAHRGRGHRRCRATVASRSLGPVEVMCGGRLIGSSWRGRSPLQRARGCGGRGDGARPLDRPHVRSVTSRRTETQASRPAHHVPPERGGRPRRQRCQNRRARTVPHVACHMSGAHPVMESKEEHHRSSADTARCHRSREPGLLAVIDRPEAGLQFVGRTSRSDCCARAKGPGAVCAPGPSRRHRTE